MNGYHAGPRPFTNQFDHHHHHDCDHQFGSGPGSDFHVGSEHEFDYGGSHRQPSFDYGKSLLGSLFRIFLHDENPFVYNNAQHWDLGPWKINWYFTGFNTSPKPVQNENNFNGYFPGRDESNEINKSGKHHHSVNRIPTKKPVESQPIGPSQRPTSATTMTTEKTTTVTTEKTTTSTLFPKIDIRSAS